MSAPERMSPQEYTRRWRQAASVASWIAVRFAIAAWALAATASFLVTNDPVVLLVWGAAGLGAVAVAFGVLALVSLNQAGTPDRYPTSFRNGNFYHEPPVFPERKGDAS